MKINFQETIKKEIFMFSRKKLLATSFLIIQGLISISHAQTQPEQQKKSNQSKTIIGDKLEDLLLCNPAKKFTLVSAKNAFSEIGLLQDETEIYRPSKGKAPTVFGATIADATINDESDASALSVRVIDRTPEEIAKKLDVKKQRVNGPLGPENVYRKQTSKKSYIEITPAPSISPRATSIDCIFF
jgi:hypothetical protein